MTYATLYDIRSDVAWSVDAYRDDWADRSDAIASGDFDDDIADFFGGTVHIHHIYHGGK